MICEMKYGLCQLENKNGDTIQRRPLNLNQTGIPQEA